MCRLYGFRASAPTKVECTLVHAQNALMVQSHEDMAGLHHSHGWGVATYEDHTPHIERQAWAAYHGEHFRRAAARIYSGAVLAHVRRATVGPAALANTHPFTHGNWVFAHNGTVPAFDAIRAEMRAAMTSEHHVAVAGDTDSEHVFRLLMSVAERTPRQTMAENLRATLALVVSWCREHAPDAKIGLNLMLTNGRQMLGCRWGRTLHYVERHGVYDCEICGFPHIHDDPRHDYRAVVVASEPITHEAWREVPECAIFSVSPDFRLVIQSLDERTVQPGMVTTEPR